MSDVCFFSVLFGSLGLILLFILFFWFSLLPDMEEEDRRAKREEVLEIIIEDDLCKEWDVVLDELGFGDEE